MGKYRKDGSPKRRSRCAKHHGIHYGTGGWLYKIYRKDYCENIDGRLGFVCTTTIIDEEWQLDADHIDGNPSNNTGDNIQTLCKCCHAIKTRDKKDNLTDGRKTLKVGNRGTAKTRTARESKARAAAVGRWKLKQKDWWLGLV